MKVKGVVTQKYDKKRKLHRGDVIELSAEEKVVAVVKDAVAGMSEEGKTVCWAEGVTPDATPTVINAGDKFHGKYSNAKYKATGKVVIRTLNVKTDRVKPVKESSFSVDFCDCLDSLNQPELKVENFEIK